MSEEKKNSVRNSTVAISPDDAKRLDRFCQNNDITKKDFISLSLSYFEKQGINPAKHETPKAEMEKVTKRLDQFFAFMKKQEQDILRPMYMDITENRIETDNNLVRIVQNQKKLFDRFSETEKRVVSELNSLFAQLESNKKLSSEDNARLRKGLEMLLKLVDEKNKSGLMGKLFG